MVVNVIETTVLLEIMKWRLVSYRRWAAQPASRCSCTHLQPAWLRDHERPPTDST
jgi:hypothetical protein